MRLMSERVVVGAMLVLSLITLGLQAFVLRPRLWPAGPGLALSGDVIFARLGAPRPIAVIRPPEVAAIAASPATVVDVFPGGAADQAGIGKNSSEIVISLSSPAFARAESRSILESPAIDLQPGDAESALRRWRLMQQMTGFINPGGVDLDQPSIWSAPNSPWSAWLRQHLGPLVQMTAFLAGAAVLLLLGAHGTPATLATLALIATAVAHSGPLLGSPQAGPIVGPVALWFNWLITPLSFPIIGLAVLYFPSRAEILDRQKWVIPAVVAACAPMLIISIASAAFLSGADAALPALAWFATHGWTFEASFALCLAVNVLIIVEGIKRYRVNLD